MKTWPQGASCKRGIFNEVNQLEYVAERFAFRPSITQDITGIHCELWVNQVKKIDKYK